jgi:selenocysteine lyase/cysteine desulfurase
MTSPSFDLPALRTLEFPWTDSPDTPVVYLNTAATGPLPARSVAMLEDWTRRRMTPWTITDHDTIFPALRSTRAACARLVGADSAEIALMSNTSYGLSLAAQSLPLLDGDVVVASADEFPTVVASWRTPQPTRRIEVRLVAPRNGWPDEDALIDELDRSNAKALAVSWVSFATGYRADLKRLGAACRERGAFFVVDAMQGLGVIPLDVTECNVDVLACGGFKWLLAPWGSGFAYVRKALINDMNPPALGWLFSPQQEDYTRGLDFNAPLYDDARRFEVMTLPSQDLAAMGLSIDLLSSIGVDAIASHVTALANRIVQWALAEPRVRLVTPQDPQRRAGIVSVAPPNAAEASKALRAAGVIHSLRQGALRLSPHCFNTAAEVDAALDILGRILDRSSEARAS